jgi:hydroxyacylglutathione hydrolase
MKACSTFRRNRTGCRFGPARAGSACGKGISAIPHSTLGYERRFNWAFQAGSERAFVAGVLAGQPEPPKYFAEMKRMNKQGPRVLGGFPRPPLLDMRLLDRHLHEGALVVDTRRAADFAMGHVPGTINIPSDSSFTTYAGWFVPYNADFYVIVDDRAPGAIDVIVRDLAMIGLDRIAGYFDASVVDDWAEPAAACDGSANHRRGSQRVAGARRRHARGRAQRKRMGDRPHPGARHIRWAMSATASTRFPRPSPSSCSAASGIRSSIAAKHPAGAWRRAGDQPGRRHQRMRKANRPSRRRTTTEDPG